MSVAVDTDRPVTAALAQLCAAFESVTDTDLWSVGDAGLSDAVVEASSVVAAAHGLLCRLVGEVDARGVAVRAGAASTVAWLKERTLCSGLDAGRVVAVARGVRGPAAVTGGELSAGVITFGHAHAITRAVTDLPAWVDEPVRRAAEDFLLNAAAEQDPVVVGRLGQRILAVVAPEVDEARAAEQLAWAEESDRRNRELRVSPDGHGRHYLSGWLDTEGAAVLTTALRPLSAPRVGADGARDMRSPGTRRADALVELLGRTLDDGGLPEVGGERPHVTITMTLATLTQAIGTAVLDTGDPVSAATARRIACDAGVVPVVLGGASQPLDVGRTRRTIPTAIRRALAERDAGCAFPGCDRPPAYCQGHHIRHWADGGPTSLANLVLLCGHHHRVVHHHGWAIAIAPDGHPEFTPPSWIDGQRKPRRQKRVVDIEALIKSQRR